MVPQACLACLPSFDYEEYDDQNLEHVNADEDSDVPMWDEDGNILMDDSDKVYENDEPYVSRQNN